MGERIDRRTERYRCSSPGCGAVHRGASDRCREDDLAVTAARLAHERPYPNSVRDYAEEKWRSLFWAPLIGHTHDAGPGEP